jgi:hypothetical protein
MNIEHPVVYFYPFSRFDAEGVKSIVELHDHQYTNEKEPFTLIMVDNFSNPPLSNQEKEIEFNIFMNQLGIHGFEVQNLTTEQLSLPLSQENRKLLKQLTPEYGWSNRKRGRLMSLVLIDTKTSFSIQLLFVEMDALNVFFNLRSYEINILLKLPGGGLNTKGLLLFAELIHQTNNRLIKTINIHEVNFDMERSQLATFYEKIGSFDVYHAHSFDSELAKKIKSVNGSLRFT